MLSMRTADKSLKGTTRTKEAVKIFLSSRSTLSLAVIRNSVKPFGLLIGELIMPITRVQKGNTHALCPLERRKLQSEN